MHSRSVGRFNSCPEIGHWARPAKSYATDGQMSDVALSLLARLHENYVRKQLFFKLTVVLPTDERRSKQGGDHLHFDVCRLMRQHAFQKLPSVDGTSQGSPDF